MITFTIHFFQVQLDGSRRNLSLPTEHLFWIRFHQSAKWLPLVLSTSARPSLCASVLVFFSIFKLIVFSMLNDNVFATLMKSEVVKKIGNCCCFLLFFIKFIELGCKQMYFNTKTRGLEALTRMLFFKFSVIIIGFCVKSEVQ